MMSKLSESGAVVNIEFEYWAADIEYAIEFVLVAMVINSYHGNDMSSVKVYRLFVSINP